MSLSRSGAAGAGQLSRADLSATETGFQKRNKIFIMSYRYAYFLRIRVFLVLSQSVEELKERLHVIGAAATIPATAPFPLRSGALLSSLSSSTVIISHHHIIIILISLIRPLCKLFQKRKEPKMEIATLIFQ